MSGGQGSSALPAETAPGRTDGDDDGEIGAGEPCRDEAMGGLDSAPAAACDDFAGTPVDARVDGSARVSLASCEAHAGRAIAAVSKTRERTPRCAEEAQTLAIAAMEDGTTSSRARGRGPRLGDPRML